MLNDRVFVMMQDDPTSRIEISLESDAHPKTESSVDYRRSMRNTTDVYMQAYKCNQCVLSQVPFEFESIYQYA